MIYNYLFFVISLILIPLLLIIVRVLRSINASPTNNFLFVFQNVFRRELINIGPDLCILAIFLNLISLSLGGNNTPAIFMVINILILMISVTFTIISQPVKKTSFRHNLDEFSRVKRINTILIYFTFYLGFIAYLVSSMLFLKTSFH